MRLGKAIAAAIADHALGSYHRWTLDKLRLGAGAGADPTEIDVPPSGPWELVSSQNPSNVQEAEFTGLSGDLFLVVYMLYQASGASPTPLRLNLNGITAANYSYIRRTGTTLSQQSGQGDFVPGQLDVNAYTTGSILINGKVVPANTKLHYSHFGCTNEYPDMQGIQGRLTSCGGDLTIIRLAVGAGLTFTGIVKVYKLV